MEYRELQEIQERLSFQETGHTELLNSICKGETAAEKTSLCAKEVPINEDPHTRN